MPEDIGAWMISTLLSSYAEKGLCEVLEHKRQWKEAQQIWRPIIWPLMQAWRVDEIFYQSNIFKIKPSINYQFKMLSMFHLKQ